MAELQTFGQRLKLLRTELGLTQRQFAERIGITASALSAYETGQKNPSVGVAVDVALAYGESLDWLCGLSRDSDRNIQNSSIRTTLRCLILLCNSGALTINVGTDGESEWLEGLTVDNVLENFLMVYHQTTYLRNNGHLTDESYSSIQGACVEETTRELIDKYFSNTDSKKG